MPRFRLGAGAAVDTSHAADIVPPMGKVELVAFIVLTLSFARTQRWINLARTVLISLSAVISGSLWLSMKVDELSLTRTYVSCVVLALLFLVLIVSAQAWADSALAGAGLKTDHPYKCVYCASDTANIICKDCKTVQWERVSQSGHRPLVAGFLVGHRWPLIAAAVPFFLTGLISLGVYANGLQRARREARLTAARRVGDAGSGFRGALLAIEAMCSDPRAPECAKHVDALRENYYRYSLEAPGVISELRRICQDPPNPEKEKSRAATCKLMETCDYEKAVDRLNGDFREYVNALVRSRCAATDAVQERRGRAKALYENGRIVQCAVAEVAYDAAFFGQDKPFSTYVSCEEPGWIDSKGVELKSCPELPPKGKRPFLEWERWSASATPCPVDRGGVTSR